MEDRRKILLIDKSADRKDRIRMLKDRGFGVYPALKIAEARNRCKPGSYDLIVVDSGDDQNAALALCDEVRNRSPKQHLLLMVAQDSSPARDYLVSRDPAMLAEKIEALLGRRTASPDLGLAA